jgi:hypothetical protein
VTGHEQLSRPCTTRVTRILDWDDEALVASMESEAYGAFSGGASSALLRKLWLWDDDARRVRTRVPFEDQRAWIETDGARVHTAIVVNTRLAVLQSAAYGFVVPAELDDGRGLCEFTLAYSRLDHSIGHFHAAWDEAFHGLRALGFREGFATCAPRVLPLYRRMGARILADAEIGGEVRHFLHFNLERTSRWNARVVEREETPAGREEITSAGRDERLALARQETGLVLARVLVALEIARGQPDTSFGIDVRRAGAQHVLSTVRHALAVHDGTGGYSTAFQRAREHADDVERLWDAVVSLVKITDEVGHASEMSPAAMIVESLHTLIVALLDAWDGDMAAGILVERMSRGDQGADLAAATADLRALGHAGSAHQFDRLAVPFAQSTVAIGRIAARVTAPSADSHQREATS